ncbi:hypothetical protein GF376_02925 [Candidatus Peregrinibacteria bacterium]|nr:hypothetical protein [Candidatus Peregrinibacteria bacterium]
MNKKLIVGNWKMNLTVKEAVKLAKQLKNAELKLKHSSICVCPSFSAISEVSKILKDSQIGIGAQNISYEYKGPFTGEESVQTIQELGINKCIIGHSDRRHKLSEDNKIIARKAKLASDSGMHIILCIGETYEAWNMGKSKEYLEKELESSIALMTRYDHLTIAYEPVHHISTNLQNSDINFDEVENMHNFIKGILKYDLGTKTAENIHIIYGGSVNLENINNLLDKTSFSGVFVGKSSINCEQFINIAKKVDQNG